MSFNYPLGFLGLIGIPILIIIYLIKNRYVEQTVASVYLWELSEKFLKRKKRIKPFTGILSLILQITAVLAITLALVQPVFIIPDSAYDYCFILDGSGSMNFVSDGKTRFEEGKDRIEEVIRESKGGSTYSLILAGDSTAEIFKNVTDKDVAIKNLKKLDCSWTANGCADAVGVAREYFTEDHSPIMYLVTDKDYVTENVNLINLSNNEKNYAFVSYDYIKSAAKTVVRGQVISYIGAEKLQIELYVDGTLSSTTEVNVEELTPTAFEISTTATNFKNLRVVITNGDALEADNEGIMYSPTEGEQNRTLIISDAPGYLQFVLKASGKTSVDVISTKKYAENKSGYDGYGLYVFDTFAEQSRLPEDLPTNAAVWFFNLRKSVAGTGFGFRDVAVSEGDAYYEPTYTNATSSFARALTEDLIRQPIAVKEYAKYMTNRNFTTVMSNGGDSLIFAGSNEKGCRQVVFAFDLHDSDIALKADFPVLINNLLSYSFPSVIDNNVYSAGEEMIINAPTECENIKLVSPSNKVSYPDFSSSYGYVRLSEIGTYRLTATVKGAEQVYNIFVKVPEQESFDTSETAEIKFDKFTDSTFTDGFYDGLTAYFVVMLLVFIFDWGVYCYEQYQLR